MDIADIEHTKQLIARDDLISISLTAEQWDALVSRPYVDDGLKFSAETAIKSQVPDWEQRALASDTDASWMPGPSIFNEALKRLRSGAMNEMKLGPYHLQADEMSNMIIIDADLTTCPDGIDILTSRMIIELASALEGYTTAWNGFGEDTMTLQFTSEQTE